MRVIARSPSSATSNRRSRIYATGGRGCCSRRTTRCKRRPIIRPHAARAGDRAHSHAQRARLHRGMYAIDRATHDWIFVIDADERVTPKLRDEILRTLNGPLDRWAYSVGRLNFMFGKPVRFSGLQRDRVTRLFHRGHARYPNRRVHADLIVDGETGHLQQKMDHYYIRNFDHMIKKMTRYAEWGAAQMYIDGKTTSAAGILGHTTGKFFRDFVINLGFLDGVRGVISVGMHVYYTFWKYAKLWEMHRLKRMGNPVALPKLDESEERWELPWQK